jgi:hypothetical protein
MVAWISSQGREVGGIETRQMLEAHRKRESKSPIGDWQKQWPLGLLLYARRVHRGCAMRHR